MRAGALRPAGFTPRPAQPLRAGVRVRRPWPSRGQDRDPRGRRGRRTAGRRDPALVDPQDERGSTFPSWTAGDPASPASPPSAFLRKDLPPVFASSLSSLRPDGFLVGTSTGNLYIVSGGGKGVIYGVVHLLEKYFGCRRYSPTAEVFPPRDDLALGCLFEADNPATRSASSTANSPSTPTISTGCGSTTIATSTATGYYVHTFQRLVPWQTYFADSPRVFRPDEREADHRPALPVAARGLRYRRRQAPRGDGRPAGQEDLVGQPERQFLLLPVPRMPRRSSRRRARPPGPSSASSTASPPSSPTRRSRPWPTSILARRRA